MRLRTRPCSNCGAPLQAGWATRTIECSHCRVVVAVEDDVVMAKAFHRAAENLELPQETRELARVSIADVPYRVLGKLGSGESSEVFLAERAHRLTERVALKLLRAAGDADLFEREYSTLRSLRQSSARGAEHFIGRLPQPIALGTWRAAGGPVRAMVQRFHSGFVHTVEDVRRAQTGGLDPRHGVWIWRRLLELLGFLHESGVVHGALLPRHVLIHARDHGAMLVGYGCAGKTGEALPAVVTSCRAHYPGDVGPGVELRPGLDVTMAARVVLYALGAEPGRTTAPARIPTPLGALLERVAVGSEPPARELLDEVTEVAREVYGAPRYVPLHMPRS